MSVNFDELTNQEYKYGFVTNIEQDIAPRGLNEDIIRLISSKKNEPEWMLEWRLKAYRHWCTMKEPKWHNVRSDIAPRGLNEDIIRLISSKKNEPEWMLEWRLKAYRHWCTMKEPKWHNV